MPMSKIPQPQILQAQKYRAIRRGSVVSLIAFALVCLLLAGTGLLSFHDSAQAQKRRVRRPAPRPSSAVAAIDYSRFSHSIQKHQGACNTCHKLPTDNWKKVRDYPDVADYPGHAACVSCHRPQFFKGAKPPICSVCHAKVSPRDEARFAFRNPASRREFLIEFPHDKHQDVIARLLPQNPVMPNLVTQTLTSRGLRTWAHVRPSETKPSQTPTGRGLRYNNCEICHTPRSVAPVAPPTGWIDSFVPDAAAFRAVPTSHASCFNCHWKSEQPTGENCGGCHKSLSTNVSANTSRLTSENPKPTDSIPFFLWDLRISLKFRHAREQHVAECTACHINITKSSTVRGLKPDVPITACTECHNKDGLRLDVSGELEAIDKNRDFTCSYCHTSDVGRRDPPASHYLIAGREALKRKDVK
jgi:hypothetical protein